VKEVLQGVRLADRFGVVDDREEVLEILLGGDEVERLGDEHPERIRRLGEGQGARLDEEVEDRGDVRPPLSQNLGTSGDSEGGAEYLEDEHEDGARGHGLPQQLLNRREQLLEQAVREGGNWVLMNGRTSWRSATRKRGCS
jgi:hypothetical protein